MTSSSTGVEQPADNLFPNDDFTLPPDIQDHRGQAVVKVTAADISAMTKTNKRKTSSPKLGEPVIQHPKRGLKHSFVGQDKMRLHLGMKFSDADGKETCLYFSEVVGRLPFGTSTQRKKTEQLVKFQDRRYVCLAHFYSYTQTDYTNNEQRTVKRVNSTFLLPETFAWQLLHQNAIKDICHLADSVIDQYRDHLNGPNKERAFTPSEYEILLQTEAYDSEANDVADVILILEVCTFGFDQACQKKNNRILPSYKDLAVHLKLASNHSLCQTNNPDNSITLENGTVVHREAYGYCTTVRHLLQMLTNDEVRSMWKEVNADWNVPYDPPEQASTSLANV